MSTDNPDPVGVQGDSPLSHSGLVQAAQAAVRCQGTYLASVFRRLAPRRGKTKAIMAVAHRLLRAAYHILLQREPTRT